MFGVLIAYYTDAMSVFKRDVFKRGYARGLHVFRGDSRI